MGYIRCGSGGGSFQELNDINTWLKLGGVSGTYSSLSDILADTTALNKLMTTKNSVDYLVGCDDFISDICASQNGMNAIGASNLAANSLLEHDNWIDGIANSSYIESVLNISVPIMTSNTTPNGQCFGTRIYSGYDYYQAFRGVDSAKFSIIWYNGSIGYKFPAAQKIYAIRIYRLKDGMNNSLDRHIKFQASLDGNNWLDMTAQIVLQMTGTTHWYVSNIHDTAYQYYRLLGLDTDNNLQVIAGLNFYGRQDV